MALVYFLAAGVFLTGFLAKIPLGVLIVGSQIIFVVYDYLYSRAILLYEREIRRRLLRSRD
jgi:hypothetical protein